MSIKGWIDDVERRLVTLEAQATVMRGDINQNAQRIAANSEELRLHVQTLDVHRERLDNHSERLTELEAGAPPEPEPPVDLGKYKGIEAQLAVMYDGQWGAIASVGSADSRHLVDGYWWLFEATGIATYEMMAKHYAHLILDAVEARDRNLDDLRLVSGFQLLEDVEIDQRTQAIADRAGKIIMSTGQSFYYWVQNQHQLPFSWNQPQGEWQGVVGYWTRAFGGMTAQVAFRECVERGTPGVWGAGWEERYRNARSSFKAGRDVRLLEIDETLRTIFEEAWRRIAGAVAVSKFIDGTGAASGVPLFDGWNYVCPVGLMDRVLDDAMAGRSNLMADVNTHPLGFRQLALCGATALRRARA